MSRGTVYANSYPRAVVVQALINHYDLPFDIVESTNNSTFEAEFPMQKVHTLVTSEGVKLQEVIPLNEYVAKHITDIKEKTQLLSLGDDLSIALQGKFASLSNTDFFINVCYIFLASLGIIKKHSEMMERSWNEINHAAIVFNERLSKHKYLVAEDHVTLADLLSAAQFAFAFQHALGKEWRRQYPGIEAWLLRVLESPILKGTHVDFKMAEKNCDAK
ncbi:hypothetical protein TBLA_0J01030 [Henningerozyma blattae CBS 6284]|uniref:GST C-terminal domain-containing protein n=1 Tax=Henningerozyma blattae (strain ATCC 34711 / CBS 6284 / DSM 70876 / NBRC 10599 / NRRL Y-10934 / UCD 77-7) TaxID=1071380 RepID=I2H9P9_HENB6|nr:hypothetical protein TBLA_0J01030 [Tetrapisispora blattae CBS 6284]CCH63101.1 hypothetical protein TBLA_0J01030 [Tetrapisispora blattae CBS 6284]